MIKLFFDHPIIGTLLLMNFTLVYFGFVMRMQEVRDKGLLRFADNPVLWIIAYTNLPLALLMDVGLNVFPFSVLFWEFPRWDLKEFLTTARLCRWVETAPDSWCGKQAAWWGRTLLNPIDPSGKHIK